MASSIIAPVVGSVASGLIGGAGSSKANAQRNSAAQNAQQIITPKPFQANSLFFNTGANGRAELNGFGRSQFANFSQIQGRAFHRQHGFNRNEFRDRLLEASNRVNDKREGQAFSSLESKLFNRQGASTGTARQIADFGSDLEDRRFNRALQAEIGAENFHRGLVNDFSNAHSLFNNLDSQMRQTQQQSLVGAQALRPFAINNPAAAQAGFANADSTQGFFNGLGRTVGGGLEAGISAFGNPSSGGGGGGFFNPSAINFGSNPFTSLGVG